jgi:hypothetical protein
MLALVFVGSFASAYKISIEIPDNVKFDEAPVPSADGVTYILPTVLVDGKYFHVGGSGELFRSTFPIVESAKSVCTLLGKIFVRYRSELLFTAYVNKKVTEPSVAQMAADGTFQKTITTLDLNESRKSVIDQAGNTDMVELVETVTCK